MWRRIALVLLSVSLLAQAPKPNTAELERLDDLVRQVTEMRAKVAALETQMDTLLRALSEQRGALQQKPQTYNALAHVESVDPDSTAPKVRCAAMTAQGKRCTRAAKTSSRYCSQHELVHAK